MLRFVISAIVACVLAVVSFPICAGAANSGGRSTFFVNRSTSHPRLSLAHFYVVDVELKAVYRFPLDHDGLPATQPDAVLYPQGAMYPKGVAVDKLGHVFVADPQLGTVTEFAAGATGLQEPISVLNLFADEPDRIRIDDAGRMYVHFGNSQKIAVFAKGAHGNDQPISVIPSYGKPLAVPSDFSLSLSGALYVLDFGGPVAVYDNPLGSPAQPDRFVLTDGGLEFEYWEALALDSATQTAYIQFQPRAEYSWDKLDFGVRSLSRSSAAMDPVLLNGQCGDLQGAPSIGGAEVADKYLIVSCNNDSDVLVFLTDGFGRRRAVETVGMGTLRSPWETALGP